MKRKLKKSKGKKSKKEKNTHFSSCKLATFKEFRFLSKIGLSTL